MRIISLFSGAGGLDLGLIKSGHQIVWANDHDPDCVETYRQNIGGHITLADIQKVKSRDLPDADVVVGGFPCQGFSCANMRRSRKDERNSLYLEFLRIIKQKKPNYFIAENVRGILSLDGGKVMKMILRDFTKAGYDVQYQVINMANYGVPQSRIRVVFFGSRRKASAQMLSFPEASHTRLPNGVPRWISIGEALKSIPEPDADNHSLKNHICSRYKVTNRNFTGHRRTNPDKPSPTILARGNGKGGVCAIQHPQNHRRLSVRESAIIQSFPLNFEFSGSLNSMYRQVGNAVPPLFAYKLGKMLKRIEMGA